MLRSKGSPGVGWDQLGGKYPSILGRFEQFRCCLSSQGEILPGGGGGGRCNFFEIMPGGGGGGEGGRVQIFFWNLTPFFDFKFKNTSNLIFLGFKVPSQRFFPKDFKIGLTF